MQKLDCWKSKPCHDVVPLVFNWNKEKMLLYYLIKWQSNSSQITHMLHWCCLPSSHYQSTSTWSLQAWHCPQLQVMKESLLLFHLLSRVQWQLWSLWWPRQSVPPSREETLSLRRLSWSFHFVSGLKWQLWSFGWSRQSILPPRLETLSLRRLSWRPADPRSTFLPPPCCWRVQSILVIWISLDGDSSLCIISSTKDIFWPVVAQTAPMHLHHITFPRHSH